MMASPKQKRKENIKSKASWVLIHDTSEARISYLLDFAKADISRLKYDERLQFVADFERYIFRRVFRTSDFEGEVILDEGPSPLDLLGDDNLKRIRNLQVEINNFLQILSLAIQKNVNQNLNNIFETSLKIDCRVSVCKTEAGDVISIFTTPQGSDKQRLMFELLSLFSDIPVDYIHKCEHCEKLFYKEKNAIYCTKKCMVNMNTKRYRERHPEAFKLSQQKQYEKRIGSNAAKSLNKRRQEKQKIMMPFDYGKNK